MANKYNVSPAKICLRYCLENNTLPLPKSVHEERIIDNLDLNFTLSKEDMDLLNTIHDETLDRPLRS